MREEVVKNSARVGLDLIRFGWIALALNSVWTFSQTVFYTWQEAQALTARLEVGFAELGLAPEVYFGVTIVSLIITYLFFFVVAVLIFLRRPDDRMALFVGVFLMALGTAGAYPAAPEFLAAYTWEHGEYSVPFLINNLLAWPVLIPFFALYPDGQFVPRWMRFISVYGFLFALGWGAFPLAFAQPEGLMAVFVGGSVALVFGASLFAQVYRYRRHATGQQRQQIKWMVYGFAVVVLSTVGQQIILATVLAAKATPGQSVIVDLLATVMGTTYVLVPLAVGVAILRYRLYEIDLIIRRTLIYGALTALLLLVYLGSVVLLQRMFSAVTGQEQNELVTVLSTLAIAALFVPLRNRVQEFIDRRFYRRKYDAQRVLENFAATARDETDLERLTGRLLEVVEETMEPASVSLWLKKG